MLSKNGLFGKLFGKDEKEIDKAPEVMGLYIGGSFEIDPLKLKLLQPQLVIDNAASQHLIQAVGEVNLDSGGKILRFYTDDDAFLQVVMDGGDTENHISDVKLWYFYDTKTVGSDSQWQQLLKQDISRPEYSLEEQSYHRVWDAVGEESPPVAMTEKTWEQDNDISETDQFVMLYERQLSNGDFEALMVSAEEKLIEHNLDRCLVLSTGFNIEAADIRING